MRGPHLHYFAFGSNMNPERVRARGLAFGGITGAHLEGYRLVFDKAAAEHPGSGHANIAWARGHRVEGVLYALADARQIEKMDPFERTPINYSRELVLVKTATAVVAAWTYIGNAAVRRADGRPEPAYLAHLLAGRAWLSADYYERLAAWPLATPVGADD